MDEKDPVWRRNKVAVRDDEGEVPRTRGWGKMHVIHGHTSQQQFQRIDVIKRHNSILKIKIIGTSDTITSKKYTERQRQIHQYVDTISGRMSNLLIIHLRIYYVLIYSFNN